MATTQRDEAETDTGGETMAAMVLRATGQFEGAALRYKDGEEWADAGDDRSRSGGQGDARVLRRLRRARARGLGPERDLGACDPQPPRRLQVRHPGQAGGGMRGPGGGQPGGRGREATTRARRTRAARSSCAAPTCSRATSR
ncbi:MAG: hypothetical protein WKF31_04430 [Thermoleophilaceae bacterium]